MPASPNNILQEIISEHPFLGIEKDTGKFSRFSGLEPPAWIHEGPVYEIFVRSYSQEGTFAQITQNIPHLKDLGIKTIWLMPIHPVGKEGRKGKFGSPYAIKDHMNINDHYGTRKDLQHLINEIHAHDMKIILDLVANHTALDHVWLKDDPDLFYRDKGGDLKCRISDWTDVADLDYHHPATSSYMLEIVKYWIQEFDIDGYRCDVAGMVPLEFWEKASDAIRKLKNDFFLLAEWESSRMHVNAFHATYDWTLYLVFKEIFKLRRPVADCLEWAAQKRHLYPENALFLRFTENHDFPRTTETFGLQSFYPYAALPFCLQGIPLLYAGQEVGATKKPSLFEKEAISWNSTSENIYNFYKRLIKVRRENQALSSDKIKIIRHQQHERVLAFYKYNHSENILIILNFSDEKIRFKVERDNNLFSGRLVNLITGDSYNSKDINNGLDLMPFVVLLLKPA